MNSINKFNKNQSGQAALEAAIILIAFVVVASVFAFAVLSAGTASTERGEQAIYNGLEQVQSSLGIKGAVIAESNATNDEVASVVFTVGLVSGGDAVTLDSVTATGSAAQSEDPSVVISYRDAAQAASMMTYTVNWIVGDEDTLLEAGELAEISVDLSALPEEQLIENTPFTLEVKPPTGGILGINRTTPAALEAIMELR